MDNPSVCHASSMVPDKWPAVTELWAYRERVCRRVRATYQRKVDRSVGRVLALAYEHEAMHLETLLHMVLFSASARPPKGAAVPAWADNAALPLPNMRYASVAAGDTVLGYDDPEEEDSTHPDTFPQTYVWDNECKRGGEDALTLETAPRRVLPTPAFDIQQRQVSNSEYLAFLRSQTDLPTPHPSAAPSAAPSPMVVRPNSKFQRLTPALWVCAPQLDPPFQIRTVFGPIPLALALNWPAMVTHEQASAYAAASPDRLRLPREEELLRFYGTLHAETHDTNYGFAQWTPSPVRALHRVGAAWEWTDTVFARHADFVPSKLYPGYSADFMGDGLHRVVRGASFATVPRLAGRLRNFYQHNYPYALISFRCVKQ